MSVNKTKLVNIGYRKSYKLIKRSKENRWFLLKLFLKKNNETNKQEQNISSYPKMTLLDTLHAKAFKS